MTDRLRLDQHTDDTLTELYDQLDHAKADMALCRAQKWPERLARAEAERDQHAKLLAEILNRFTPTWPRPDYAMRQQATVLPEDYDRWRTALACPSHPPAAVQAEPHSCDNCEGIDPDTCLMNPNSPPEQCPAARADTALCRCGHTRKQHQDNTGLGGAQCRVCPGDEERSWRHPYTPTERSAPC